MMRTLLKDGKRNKGNKGDGKGNENEKKENETDTDNLVLWSYHIPLPSKAPSSAQWVHSTDHPISELPSVKSFLKHY
jgi:hypothetical protein